MSAEKEIILRYLSDLRAHEGAYHNHKELSAWGAIALAVLIAGPLLASVIGGHPNPIWLRWIVLAVVAVIWIGLWLYIRMQFHLRSWAANVVNACGYWSTVVLTMDDSDIEPERFKLEPRPDRIKQGPYTLPACVAEYAEHLAPAAGGALRTLEGGVYSVLGALGVLAVIHIFVRA